MHGRVKVRTTEEENLRKEKARLAKLQLFRNVTEKIERKRKEGALDKELLDYIGQLLTTNPDISTLWNIRREVLQTMRAESNDMNEMSKIYDSELLLTEYCLKVNPKSYGAWHQREWVLTTRADPDWKKELALCNIYLKLDERNFHTWDYRRFIVSQSNTPLEEEFKFTTEKIHENFSNYSAWHYRSKLLVELFPDSEGGRPIADAQHKNELEIVERAAFTDPDDTSAWFYQRWLLGAVKKTIKIVVCSITPDITTVAFNTSVSRANVAAETRLIIDGNRVAGEWTSISGRDFDYVWLFNHGRIIVENLDIKVESGANEEKQLLRCKEQKPGKYLGITEFNFQNHYSEPVIEELKKQLVSCQQLLDLEPDSKCTLLTTTFLMHCCDPAKNLNEALKNLIRLKEIDKLRSGYYGDIASKWIIEEYLVKYGSSIENVPPLHSIYNIKITSLYHMQYFCAFNVVDLSNHNLTSRVLPMISPLQNCEMLDLGNNLITHLKKFPHLPRLRQLRLTGNIIEASELQEFVKTWGKQIEILV